MNVRCAYRMATTIGTKTTYTTIRGMAKWRRLMEWLASRWWSSCCISPCLYGTSGPFGPRRRCKSIYNKSVSQFFFLFSAMMGPPFLVRVAQPTALFFSFQVPLVVWNRCLVLCVQYTWCYSRDLEYQRYKRQTIGYSLSFVFFSFLSTAHWFHFCWHEKNIYKIQKKRGPRWGVDRKSIKGFHSSVCARWRRVWWLMSLPGQGSKQADLFCSCAPPLSDPETRLLLMPLLLSEMLP